MRLLAATAALLSLAVPAWAIPVTYDFSGTVTQVGPNVLRPISVGDVIAIEVTVDTSYPATSPGSGQYYSTGVYNPSTMLFQIIQSATFGGEQANALVQGVTLTNSSINFRTASPQISAGFALNLSGAPAGTFPTLDLPLTINPSVFAAGTFSVTEAFSPTTYGYSGVINGLAATMVPEPASLALLGVGVAGIAAMRRRRGG